MAIKSAKRATEFKMDMKKKIFADEKFLLE